VRAADGRGKWGQAFSRMAARPQQSTARARGHTGSGARATCSRITRQARERSGEALFFGCASRRLRRSSGRLVGKFMRLATVSRRCTPRRWQEHRRRGVGLSQTATSSAPAEQARAPWRAGTRICAASWQRQNVAALGCAWRPFQHC
jgi:hypothetical protein